MAFHIGHKGLHLSQINDITIKPTLSLTLLAITIDSKLNFKDYIDHVIQKTNHKVYATKRLLKFLTFKKAKVLATS